MLVKFLKLKLDYLMKDIKKNYKHFGHVNVFLHTIHFQKQFLQHVYCLEYASSHFKFTYNIWLLHYYYYFLPYHINKLQNESLP